MRIPIKYLLVAVTLCALIVGAVFTGRRFLHLGKSVEIVSGKEKGPKDAPIQMDVYSDFQCPACRNALPMIEEIEQKYSPYVKVIFRQFPLEHNHAWSLLAAQFSECAAQQRKFWEFHGRIYATQEEWSKLTDVTPRFIGFAQEIGLDLKVLEVCLGKEEIISQIRKERETGAARGVQSTPTIFIGTEVFVGGPQLKERAPQVIEKELERLGIKIK